MNQTERRKYLQDWRKNNREKDLALKKKWRGNNKKLIKKMNGDYYLKNRNKINKKKVKYYKKNMMARKQRKIYQREYSKDYNQIHNKLFLIRQTDYYYLKRRLLKLFQRCPLCLSKRNLEMHHLNYSGGNIILICRKCHRWLHRKNGGKTNGY